MYDSKSIGRLLIFFSLSAIVVGSLVGTTLTNKSNLIGSSSQADSCNFSTTVIIKDEQGKLIPNLKVNSVFTTSDGRYYNNTEIIASGELKKEVNLTHKFQNVPVRLTLLENEKFNYEIVAPFCNQLPPESDNYSSTSACNDWRRNTVNTTLRCNKSIEYGWILRQTSLPNRSMLWGDNGEMWIPQSRLPDYSYAGYESNNQSIPSIPQVFDVTTFGANGQDQIDDSEAFLRAMEALENGALYIPEGKYIITRVLKINKSNVVLRGAGRDRTILYFPKSLAEVAPEDNIVSPEGSWSWNGGFIWVEGTESKTKLANVIAPALRGDTTIRLSSTTNVSVGSYVRLEQYDNPNDKSLGKHLHANQAEAGHDLYTWTRVNESKSKLVDWVAKVKSIRGDYVTLDRPLRYDVRLQWDPAIFTYNPTVQKVGIENFELRFLGDQLEPHHAETGDNGIMFMNAANSWLKNIIITDADGGVYLDPGSRFVTITGIELRALRRTPTGIYQSTGHHGIDADMSQDCLVTDFVISTPFIHSISVENLANGNVFRKGRGTLLSFDHHRGAPHENLFTDIDIGSSSRMWWSFGAPSAGPYSGARETFWNIQSPDESLPPVPAFPQINVVGLKRFAQNITSEREWIENVNLEQFIPEDLFEAQLQKRYLY